MHDDLKQLYELACTPFTDLESLTAQILSSIATILGMESAAIGRIHGATWQAMGVYGYASTSIEVGATLPLEKTFCHMVVQTGDALVIPDAARDPEFCHHPDYTESGTRAYVGVPLRVRGLLWGVLCGFDRAPKRFDESKISLLALLAQRLAFEFERKAWERKLEAAYGALRRIPSLLAAGLDMQQTLTTLTEMAATLVGDGVATMEDSDAQSGCEGHREEGPHACAGFPLLFGDRCLGVLRVMRRGSIPFSDEEITLLQGFTDLAALALENARLFQQISRAKREWEQTVDAIPEGVALLDEQGGLTRMNTAFAALWSLSPEGLIGSSWHDLWDGLKLSSPCPHCEAWWTKQPATVEASLPASSRILTITAFPPEAQRPSPPAGTILVIRDITAERRTERLTLLGQLAAGVAHELNNPLSVILGYAQLLLKGADPASQAYQDLKLIEKHARTCRRIVDDLRQLTHPFSLKRELYDLNGLIQDTLASVEGSLASQQIAVHLCLDPSLPPVSVDPLRLGQALRNLIVNAADAMPEGGRLTMTTRPLTPDFVEVAISDTGVGIKPEHLGRIFDPFFTTKSVGKGIGLGLALTLRIVEAHKGHIEVESEVGKGTTFRLLFPQTPDARP